MAVLDANPKGRAFWEREGFRLRLADREVTIGMKTQIAHRLGKDLQSHPPSQGQERPQVGSGNKVLPAQPASGISSNA